MKSKYLILSAGIFLTITKGFSQDSSKLTGNKALKNNSDSVGTIVDPNAPTLNQKRATKAHAAVNPNRGTSLPSTTSGTLNSTVNPNTQFVIPFHKKKKAKPGVAPDSGISIPK